MSVSEEGGSQLVLRNENVFMVCCVCVHSWAQSKGMHDHDVDKM